jgi:hypothetical protein
VYYLLRNEGEKGRKTREKRISGIKILAYSRTRAHL